MNKRYLGSEKGWEDSQLGPQKSWQKRYRGGAEGWCPSERKKSQKTGAEGEPVMCISKIVQLCRVCRSVVGKEEISCGG